ncbi:MAG: pitrilysin family protein, partial [Anaerolineales bacterium]
MKLTDFAHLKSLPGPEDTTRVVLPNGITVLARANYDSPSVVLNGYLTSGSMYDSDEKAGLAHFTASALMRGTQKRSFQQIFDALESVGASLGFGASVHNTSFGGRALVEDLPLLLELLAECLTEPVFPPEYVERLRAQHLAALAIRAQDTADMASLTFDRILFPDHPYGRSEEGYPETIQSITREDLLSFHQKHYGPRNMVIVIVGGIEPQVAVAQVQEKLGNWQNPNQAALPELPAIHPPEKMLRNHVHIPGKSQCDLVMGSLGPCRNSEDYLPASLGNNILGQFGMMGRIGNVVREQEGLAYYASTSLNAWIVGGSWEISAGVNQTNLERAIELITKEIRRFITEPVSQEELEDSQSSFIGRLPLSLESNAGVAGAL